MDIPDPTKTAPASDAPTPDTSSTDTYVPRYTGSNSVSATTQTYTGADGNTYYQGGGGIAPTPTKSLDQIQAEKMSGAQDSINSLNQYESSLLADQAKTNEERSRSTASVNTLTGLGGSSEANVTTTKTNDENTAANKKIHDQVQVQMQTLLDNVRQSATDEEHYQQESSRLDESAKVTNDANRLAIATDHVKNIAASGITLDGLKASDPQSYQYLSDAYGGEAALKGAFILNTPSDQILDKQIVDGMYVVAIQNPVTGKVTTQTLDLGLPSNYTKTIDAGDVILAQPDNWDGDPSKLIAIQKGLTPKDASDSSDSGAPSNYNGEFDATIKLASNIPGLSNAQRAETENNLKTFIANGDYQSAYTQVLTSTASKLKGAAATTFQNQQQSLTAVNDMATSLQALHDAGYDTNKLTGAMDKVGTKLGVLATDPKYAAAATAAYTAFQQYRQNMTGAAFGAKESSEYASVLPNPSNTFELNLAKIQGAKEYLNGQVEGAIKNNIGQGGVEIKHYADTGTTPSGSTSSGQPPSEDEMAALREAFPNMSYQKIFEEATGGGKTSFSSVGNTSASVKIPKGTLAYANNNPGNLRFVGQPGASEGKGGFASFPSAQAGYQALVNQIGLDSKRGLTLSAFISKYAPPKENDTEKYIQDVVAMTGANPNTPISKIDQHKLARAIARKESSTQVA